MQTSFNEPAIGREGGIANTTFRFIMSCVVSLAAGLNPGRVCVLDDSGGSILPTVSPAVDMAADVDAFYTATATALAPVVLDSATSAGVIGLARLAIARRGTLVLNSSANWDATTALWTYINHLGQQVTESLLIPDAGNVTLYTQGLISKHVSLTIPTQSGTGGSFTVGVAANGSTALSTGTGGAALAPTSGAALSLAATPHVSVYEAMKDAGPPNYSNENRALHVQYSQMGGMRRGYIFMKFEDAFAPGKEVYVRIIATGDEQVGAVRCAPDGTDCVLLPNARVFKRSGSAGEIGILEVDFGA